MDENVKLTSQDRLDAICWAANEAGQSYGKFAATLTQAEKEAIYERYQSLLEKNAKAEKKRLETARRQQSIDPASAHKRRAGS